MALIYCPECGKEISDTAKSCIHCGYQLASKNKKEKSKKYIIILVAILIALVVALLIYKAATKIKTPFDDFDETTTIEDIHEIFGEPDVPDIGFGMESYYNIPFLNMEGELLVIYYGDIAGDVEWEYTLKDNEDISEFAEQIKKIQDYFTKEYGECTIEDDGEKTWKYSERFSYTLDVDYGHISVSFHK